MTERAHAETIVSRDLLGDPVIRRYVRGMLRTQLLGLGIIASRIRWEIDPGRKAGYGVHDLTAYALVRATAQVSR